MNVLEHYNSEKLKINDPLNIDDDTYFCKFNYNNMPFIIKTNKICYVKKRHETSKFINISLTSPDYLLWMEDLYKHCIEYVYTKNAEWFEDPLTKTEIEFAFINPLKSNIKDSCFDVQCLIDDNRLHVIDSNDNVSSIDNIENSKIIPSLHIKGIKFNNKYFMFDIELTNLYVILDEKEIQKNVENDNTIPTNTENKVIENTIVDQEVNNLEVNNLENTISEINLETNDLEQSNLNINNKEFYNAYELINNKIKDDIINNLRNIFINKKIKNNIDLYEMIEDEEDN
jgi:hypothetical protein